MIRKSLNYSVIANDMRGLFVILAFIVVFFCCSKEEEIDFDFHRVAGDFQTYIQCDGPCTIPTDSYTTSITHAGETFKLSFDSNWSGLIGEIEFKLIPKEITRSFFVRRTATIELVSGQTFVHHFNATIGNLNSFSYVDDPGGNTAYFNLDIKDQDRNLIIFLQGTRDH